MTSVAHGRGRSSTDRMLRSAARGAILIGVAVVIGIVLLQVVGDGSGPGSATPTANGNNTKSTTTTSSSARSPQEIVVAVYNGSGQSQAAGTLANELRGLGYQTPTISNWPTEQVGSTVACQTGYEEEAAQLSAVIDPSTVVAYPEAPPADVGAANCIVVVGK